MSLNEQHDFDASIEPQEYRESDPDEGYQPNEPLGMLLRPGMAEFLGTAFLVFMACGAATNTAVFQAPGPTVISVALAFGFTIFSIVFMIGHISGAHVNPVVSFSFALCGKISWHRALVYMAAQFLGALVGAGFLRVVTPHSWFAPGCLASNFVHEGQTNGHAFLTELVLTYFLLFCICAATDYHRSNQVMLPLAIGLCVTVCHLMGTPITGTSLNPARAFASSAASSTYAGCEHVWAGHYVFWVAPTIGGLLGTLTYEMVFREGSGKGLDLLNILRLNGLLDALRLRPRARRPAAPRDVEMHAHETQQ